MSEKISGGWIDRIKKEEYKEVKAIGRNPNIGQYRPRRETEILF